MDNFDKTVLEYAKNYKAIAAVEENFDEYCKFFIREINTQLIKRLSKIFNKHEGYEFKLEDDGVEEYYSSITLLKEKTKIVEFTYGFDDDIRILNSEDFLFSQEGYNFYALLSLLPKITEDKTTLKKYWVEELKSYFEAEGFGIHDHKEDTDIWVYLLAIEINEKFSIASVVNQLEVQFNDLFKNKKPFKLFSTYIPDQIELGSKQ
jgi:hypothetical protein